jgi:uncharacterized Zn finger protein
VGARLNEKGKLVERITINIKMFDTGDWEWRFRQKFHKEPHMKVDDFIKVLDGLKEEVLSLETKDEDNGTNNEHEEVNTWMTEDVLPEQPITPPKKGKTITR